MTKGRMDEIGLDTGMVDKTGAPIHLGDTLEFDAREWGDDQSNKFVIKFEEGELLCHGSPFTLDEWCTIIKKWDAV